MTNALFSGLFTGIILSSMLGTVFFCLLQNSIINGFKSGVWVSMGVILSDIILISIGHLSANLFPQGSSTETIVRICGAILLTAMGLSNLWKQKKVLFPQAEKKNAWMLAAKGFLLNILNPANYMSWLAVAATLNNVLHYSKGQQWLYYAGALSGIFGMEMAISAGAISLKKFISDRFLQTLDKVLGVVFIVFALLLIKPLLWHTGH